jgi:YihY family inner membrane protein
MGGFKQKVSTFWFERLRFQVRTGWDIFWEARRAFSRDGCMNLSAAIAFYSILSLIPFLFLLVSGASLILGSSDEALLMAINFFNQVFPKAGLLVFKEVQAIAKRADVLGWIGLFSMLWTASVIFSSLEYAMGVVFRVERRRSFVKSKLLAMAMVPASGGIFFLSLFVTVVTRILANLKIPLWGILLGDSYFFEFLIGYLFPYLVLAFAFTAVYKIIPHAPIALRHAMAGGASCALLFEGAKHFFTWYIGNHSQYGVVYGSLEAIVILVVWAFYSASILLFCAEVVSAYRRRDVTLLEKAFL